MHFSKIKTANDIKLVSTGGETINFNSEKIKSGIKNFLMDVGSKVKITTTPPSQFYHMSCSGYNTQYKDDWQSKLRDKEADV